jgi:FkbM family methyltransferase
MLSTIQKIIWTANLRIRTAVNYVYFRWHTRHSPPSGFFLEIYKALNYSKASIRFMEAAAKSSPGVGVYESAGLLLECPIKAHDVILDVGGYTGEWAEQMRSRYNALVHVFEPNPRLFDVLRGKLSSDPQVVLHPFGLAAANTTCRMSIAGMGSSVYSESPSERIAMEHVDIELRDVKEVFNELGLLEVALLKVNIEGGEYDFLSRLIACGLHTRCDCVRVQFHEWYTGSHRLRKRIVTELARTHDLEWSYPFVWESWRRKMPARPPQVNPELIAPAERA